MVCRSMKVLQRDDRSLVGWYASATVSLPPRPAPHPVKRLLAVMPGGIGQPHAPEALRGVLDRMAQLGPARGLDGLVGPQVGRPPVPVPDGRSLKSSPMPMRREAERTSSMFQAATTDSNCPSW